MKKKLRVKPLFLMLIVLLFVIVIVGGVGGLWYYLQSPVDASDDKKIEVEIKNGTTSSKIGEILKEKDLIRSEVLFKIYLKVNDIGSLKASTYKFSKSMNLEKIVKALETGVISNDNAIKITFREGERITSYAKEIADNTDMSYDDVLAVFRDREYASTLIDNYWFLTEDILNSDIYYPLEGYLAPNTYFFDQDVTCQDIIKRLLDKKEDDLEIYKKVVSSDPHYYLTMASILQLEGTNTDNRKMIAGVFENRIKSGYNLGSDVTTYYALQADMKNDLNSEQFATVNPYNTRGANMIGKMPVGPICNPDISSIEASCFPTKNDNLFFVADKNGNIYYSKTIEEHNKKTQEIKDAGNWIFS